MNQFFDPGGWFNPRYRHVSYDVTYKFPIKVEAGDVLEVHGERHIAFAKTKATPIEFHTAGHAPCFGSRYVVC